jgi:hypothetical protein
MWVSAYVDDQVEERQKGAFGGKERTEGKRGMRCISSALYLHDISHIFFHSGRSFCLDDSISDGV